MHIKKVLRFKLLITLILLPLVEGQQESLALHILNWNEADQVVWIKSYLEQGMPTSDAIVTLVYGKSSLTLPLLEKEIEDVIRSEAPKSLFINPSVDTEEVIRLAASLIGSAGDEQALREASKLIKIDSKRFGSLVGRTLDSAMNRGNPFAVAYQGLALGDPAVEAKIIAWIEELFSHQKDNLQTTFRGWWAEAMVDRYHGEPTFAQIANDPISLRLPPAEYSAMEADLQHLAKMATKKRASAH